jgi:transcriptional regulator NrdR family protein
MTRNRVRRGMKCPACDGKLSEVTRTITLPDCVVRIRCCESCKTEFRSVERVETQNFATRSRRKPK